MCSEARCRCEGTAGANPSAGACVGRIQHLDSQYHYLRRSPAAPLRQASHSSPNSYFTRTHREATAEGLQSIENITTAVKQESFDKLNLTVEVLEPRNAAWLESIRREFDRDLCTSMCEGCKNPTEP